MRERMKTMLGGALAAMLLTSGAALAHGGHGHLMGTVTKVEGTRLELKTRDGKTAAVKLTDKTVFKKGKEPATASDVSVGQRVMIDTDGAGDNPAAVEVQLGALTKAKPKAATPKLRDAR